MEKVFKFGSHYLTFARSEEAVMMNATEMAKIYKKNVHDWLRLKSTNEFLDQLSRVKGIPVSQLVVVQKGNSKNFEQGSWINEDVGLEFARWLSPVFGIWCNDRIKELLRYGITATDTTIDNILSDPDNAIRLLTELKKEREEKSKLQAQNDRLHQRTKFVDAVFETDGLIPMGQVAKVLQLEKGRNTLFKILREKGILFKNSNEPKQEHVTNGYFKLKEKYVPRENHSQMVIMQTYVTQKGLAYIAKTLGVVAPETQKIPLLN